MNASEPLIAGPHQGLAYTELLARLSRAAAVQRYLEVGVAQGEVFGRIACRHAVGVDPEFTLKTNVAANKAKVSLFQVMSDTFFEHLNLRRDIGGRIDLAFLDGMHLFEFLLRDFMNTEAICRRDSIIAMHDCLPLAEPMVERDPMRAEERSLGTPHQGWWTGDVWKVVAILTKYRPDLDVMLVDAAPTGLVIVTGLDPASPVLKRRYPAIVEEFSAIPNDRAGIGRMYAEHRITPAEEALRRLSGRSYTHGRAGVLKRLLG
ncbi:class I SAM-dependent methyltransferase [Methylobacterium sp. Leaf118]|uniref:class I SAM-dependent methyltransferase n=1 Tax=Methylobacterium sp. Leaf118 TaxID=2876562 RepID=UPI001E435CDF|nr:class I SAM-dependent methyltransferase [Methylobacterium sp. Leaf118]